MSLALGSPKLDDETKEILAWCVHSTRNFAEIFLEEEFDKPFSSGHKRAFALMDAPGIQRKVIVAHRGIGKTTIARAYSERNILYRHKKFIVPASASAHLATMQGENIKADLQENVRIRGAFGEIRSKEFSKEMWTTNTGITVMPRGSGQQVRGLLKRGNRPDLFILDDIEDDESVRNPEQREKTSDWLFNTVLGAVEKSDPNWQVLVLGTLLHEDSLLNNLLEDPAWESETISLCEVMGDRYVSLWPEHMTDAQIVEEVEMYRRRGKLAGFYREYMNACLPAEDAAFTDKMFKYYEETELNLDKDPQVETVVIYDPAKSVKAKSDETAIVGVGVNLVNHALYVRDVVSGKWHPDEQYERVFEMCAKLRVRTIGMEVTSLNEFLTHPFLNEIIKRGLALHVVDLSPRGNKSKLDRIAALSPFYRMGHVFHNRAVTAGLEAQLLQFPRSRRDDIMDALAYVVQMLSLGDRFFIPSEDDDNIEAEYAELEEEDGYAPITNWRTV